MTLRRTADDADGNETMGAGAVVLAVVAAGDADATMHSLPDGSRLRFAGFAELDAGLLRQVAPGTVVSLLASPGFDCFDLAAFLVEAGFAGRYRVAAGNLPDPALVRREMAQAFPGLDFDLLTDETVADALQG